MRVPSREELSALPAEKRLELISQARAARHQTITSAGLVLTVLISLIGVYLTQRSLISSQEGQVTDRYAKTVELLGADKQTEVRVAAIYALERLAHDSDPDRQAVRDVLAAYIREHDAAPTIKIKLFTEPDTDVAAALTVLARRPADPKDFPKVDLHAIRVPDAAFPESANLTNAYLPYVDLTGASLIGAHLTGADLTAADLTRADLTRADLTGAHLAGTILTEVHLEYGDLTGAFLFGTHLAGANLTGANLSRARLMWAHLNNAYLAGANLGGADLTGTDLTSANLVTAHLTGVRLAKADLAKADLTEADFTGADLTGADLTGANLTKILGMSEAQIRRVARTDSSTRF